MHRMQVLHRGLSDPFMNSGTKVGYGALVTKTKASDCLQCGRCEKACPQHLPIRRYLGNAAFRFERK